MKERIRSHLSILLEESALPPTTMERARRFLDRGALSDLCELPLSPSELIHAGKVVAQASPGRVFASRSRVPVLTSPIRRRLRALACEDGRHAEAALFVLAQDIKARAWNRVVTEHGGDTPASPLRRGVASRASRVCNILPREHHSKDESTENGVARRTKIPSPSETASL